MYRKKEHGFTLVELMVVIVLIGLFAGVVGVAVIPVIFKGKKTVALNQMTEMKKAIELYRLQVGTLPDDLQQLTEPYEEWEDGFMEDIPLDPWGEEYIYQRDGRRFDLYCKGEDKIEGSDDDITFDSKADEGQ
jgi:general secretion pathway protein G